MHLKYICSSSNYDTVSVDQISLDQNCHFSLDRKNHFHLIEFHLIFSLDRMTKKRLKNLT